MGTVHAYRIDHRPLEVGRVITSPGDHIDRLCDDKKVAEKILRAASSTRDAIRAKSLYIFRDLICAKKYYIGKTGFLYEVEIDEADVVHEADWTLLNRIADPTNKSETDRLVESYWAGEKGDGTTIELLVKKAAIKRLLHSPKDKMSLIHQLY